MNRRGWTLLELFIVLVILGVLANIATPAYHDMRKRAEAAQVIGDFSAVRSAAFQQYPESESFPGTGAAGVVPPELVPYLPNGFAFTRGSATYRWRKWSVPGGLPGDPSQTELMGLEIQTADAELLAAIKGLYGGSTAFGSSTQITLVIE